MRDRVIVSDFVVELYALKLSVELNVKKHMHDEFMLLFTNRLKQKPIIPFTDEERRNILSVYCD